jgi:type IV secretory pathway VirJ component
MKIKKKLFIGLLLFLLVLGMGLLKFSTVPVVQKTLQTEYFDQILIAEPLWGSQAQLLVFVDAGKFAASDLAQSLAAIDVTVAVIDSSQVFAEFDTASEKCLDNNFLASSISSLSKILPPANTRRLIVAGLGEAAIIPFINAQSASGNDAINLSLGFSVDLPADLTLCPPLFSQHRNQKHVLSASPPLEGNWRSVWTDQPPDQTAVFIKMLGNVDTRIAAYDTPLDRLLIEEVKSAAGTAQSLAPPLPVVEVPAVNPSESVTLFYSGDGGWRDLDRTVAGEMAAQNYPVVGIDVLRYFWEHKTPEQAATDLAATMAYYRQHWGVKSFVLAGYSFGADILPAIYNRLPRQDQDSVSLLVLLALANHADFEIHVSGWLGQSGGESPLAPELTKMPKQKILCVYGKEEKAETACTSLRNSAASILELPGGHHFDQDYPKLTRQILTIYQQHGIH